jgi:hypothetical protein
MADTIRYIIEALRQSPVPPGIEKVNGVPRRMAGPMMDTAAMANDINYTKYRKQQAAIGESPVSYEEWMAGR